MPRARACRMSRSAAPLALRVAIDQLAGPEDVDVSAVRRHLGDDIGGVLSKPHGPSTPDPPPGHRHPAPTTATVSVYRDAVPKSVVPLDRRANGVRPRCAACPERPSNTAGQHTPQPFGRFSRQIPGALARLRGMRNPDARAHPAYDVAVLGGRLSAGLLGAVLSRRGVRVPLMSTPGDLSELVGEATMPYTDGRLRPVHRVARTAPWRRRHEPRPGMPHHRPGIRPGRPSPLTTATDRGGRFSRRADQPPTARHTREAP